MNKKYIYVSGLIAVVIAIGAYIYSSTPATSPIAVGAVPTLDGIDSGFMKINGQREFRWTGSMVATSSAICSVKNPYGATSSIVYLSAESTNTGITAANNLFVSTSTTIYASSTPALVAGFAMGAGQWSMAWQPNSATTTANGATSLLAGMSTVGTSNYILGPSEFITWRIGTSTPGTFSTYDQGVCSAIFRKI